MPTLTDAELRMVAEVVMEMAKRRGRSYDARTFAVTLTRAALIDPAFKVRLVEVHRRFEARRATGLPAKLLVPIGPLFRDLERQADAVLSGWRKPE